jgi:hypothetical protein
MKIHQQIAEKCMDHGCSPPIYGELNEVALEKVLNLILELERKIDEKTCKEKKENQQNRT